MNPSLTEVLKSGQAAVPHNYMLFVAAIAAFLVAALAARGYTLFRRSRWISPVMDAAPSLADIELRKNREKIEKLSFLVDELKCEKEQLLVQNDELQNRLNSMEDLKQSYEIMYKGNLALARECEKLKAEKEELTLRANQLLVREKSTVKRIKKGVTRKPIRVSRKGR